MSHFMQIHSEFISLLHGNRRTDRHGEVNRLFQRYFVKGNHSKANAN